MEINLTLKETHDLVHLISLNCMRKNSPSYSTIFNKLIDAYEPILQRVIKEALELNGIHR